MSLQSGFNLTSQNNDLLKPYLDILSKAYAQLDSTQKANFDDFFDVKSYVSIFLNNNALNSSRPLWISYDLLEGPIEYYDESSSDFENLVFFYEDAYTHRIGDNVRNVCVGIGNKTASNVVVDLVVKGPENFNFNEALPETENGLILSKNSLIFSDNTNQCFEIKESPNFKYQEDESVNAWFIVELVPRTGSTVYRGHQLLVKLEDQYQ